VITPFDLLFAFGEAGGDKAGEDNTDTGNESDNPEKLFHFPVLLFFYCATLRLINFENVTIEKAILDCGSAFSARISGLTKLLLENLIEIHSTFVMVRVVEPCEKMFGR
jgi:hypothetical protein